MFAHWLHHQAGAIDNLPLDPALRAGGGILLRKFEFVAVLDHHPAAMSPARDLPLCFRFMVLFTMLCQSFNVLLPENIPDQRCQFPSCLP